MIDNEAKLSFDFFKKAKWAAFHWHHLSGNNKLTCYLSLSRK